jgi:hypothetical protein
MLATFWVPFKSISKVHKITLATSLSGEFTRESRVYDEVDDVAGTV